MDVLGQLFPFRRALMATKYGSRWPGCYVTREYNFHVLSGTKSGLKCNKPIRAAEGHFRRELPWRFRVNGFVQKYI
jgi:hypothetical protein